MISTAFKCQIPTDWTPSPVLHSFWEAGPCILNIHCWILNLPPAFLWWDHQVCFDYFQDYGCHFYTSIVRSLQENLALHWLSVDKFYKSLLSDLCGVWILFQHLQACMFSEVSRSANLYYINYIDLILTISCYWCVSRWQFFWHVRCPVTRIWQCSQSEHARDATDGPRGTGAAWRGMEKWTRKGKPSELYRLEKPSSVVCSI